MIIRPRKNLIDMFSTFLRMEEGHESREIPWVGDPRLRRNMERMVQSDPNASEAFWALFWLKEALNSPPNSRAKWHLLAYLEEPCYWTTDKICSSLAARGLKIVEIFPIARLVAVEKLDKIFANYDSDLSSVKTYAKFGLRNYTVEELKRRKKIEHIRSNWGLLRSLNPTALQRALQEDGWQESQLAPYLLAWSCFKAIYAPTPTKNRQALPAPTTQQLEAMVDRYNKQRSRHQLESAIDIEQLKELLKTCIEVVRSQSQRTPDNASSFDEIESYSPPELPVGETLEGENREAEWHRVGSILANKFTTLPEEIQTMMTLWLGFDFTQTEVAELFGLKKQYQFSRKMQEGGKLLLTELLKELEGAGNSEIQLSSDGIKKKAKQVYIWIGPHCKKPYHQFLQTTLLGQFRDYLELLRLYYGRGLSSEAVAGALNLSESEISARIAAVKQGLQQQLRPHVETTLKISLNSLSRADERLAAFVEEWLQNAPYAAF